MKFAFSSLWAVKALQPVCRYILKLRYVQALQSFFEHHLTFRKRRKTRLQTAILMVSLDHLEPVTGTGMYKAWHLDFIDYSGGKTAIMYGGSAA